MDNIRAIELLEYSKTFDEFKGSANGIALDKGIQALKTIEKIEEIFNEEMDEIRNMQPEEGENETSCEIRKQHYLAEVKAIKIRLYNELN